MVLASGVRIGWADLPERVRSAVEGIIGGGAVVEARSQPGGFSPGTADRVRTCTGRRAFVKAVSRELNEQSPELHRREAHVTAALPATVPAPRLLGCYDDAIWVALVLQDVDGHHPATSWRPQELTRVLAALADLARAAIPDPLADLPTAAQSLADDFGGWRRVATDPPPDLDPWVARHLDELCALADRAMAALAGDSLVHTDIRADNLLLDSHGTVTVVDWPWTCRGPAWLDRLLLLINVRLFGGHDTQALLNQCAADTDAESADLIATLAAFGGYFADRARRPSPAGLPTVRAFQQAQADVVRSWLQEVGRVRSAAKRGFGI
ncbi:phosphotransferase [Rugosimonospora africana]|uniref:phosphotransferase n=1 Tax=Rugosimonospora africana TaxID=556532 RepID=UPI001945B6CD|nr:phosphotransferase [Rugosimonospora africana]